MATDFRDEGREDASLGTEHGTKTKKGERSRDCFSGRDKFVNRVKWFDYSFASPTTEGFLTLTTAIRNKRFRKSSPNV